MNETIDAIARVQAMADDVDGDTWDLNARDRAALVKVLEIHREMLATLRECANVLAYGAEIPAGLLERIDVEIAFAEGTEGEEP